MPDSRTPMRSAGRSSQPQRRGRPVVAPYSPPALRRRSPCVAVELGRERSLADARRVRLGDADDRVDHRRTDARALTRARRDRRRRRHVRIRAVIEVEQAALRAFEQHVLAGGDRVRDVAAGIAGVHAQLLAGGERVVDPLRRPRPSTAPCRRGARSPARDRRGSRRRARAAAPAAADRACARRGARPSSRTPGRCRGAWCRSPCPASRRDPRAGRRSACGTAGSRARRAPMSSSSRMSRPRA